MRNDTREVMGKVNFSFDQPLPRQFCPADWNYCDFATREGAMIAADYWEERGDEDIAHWLRLWADVAPDEFESAPPRRAVSAIGAFGNHVKWAKRLRARKERMAARLNPQVEDAYGHRGIW